LRRAAEWLLLPLFLLPVGIAAGLHFWAGAAYRAELRGYREEGPARVQAWLREGGAGHDILGEFEGAHAQTLRRTSRSYVQTFRVTCGEATGQVRMRPDFPHANGGLEWRLAESYPAGLRPDALTDARTRLAVETGRTPEVTEALDAPSREFLALLDSPEIRRLSRAQLPASTKLYLVRRWRRQGVTVPLIAAAEGVLEFLRQVEPVLLERGEAFRRGCHREDGVTIMAAPPEIPLISQAPLHAPMPQDAGGWFHASDGDDGLVDLRYLGVNSLMPGPSVLWQGRVETPLAGQWAFVRRFGADWWSVPRYRRWIGPTAALLLAFLLIPTALLVSMRRRRRLDEARSRFINELAHDLRTPLTSLRLYADMLARKSSGDPERDRYAQVMTRESARVSALLGNLLDLSRLEDGRRHLALDDVCVAHVARQAADDFAQLYPARAADLTLKGPDTLAARADATALARCLANLLDNAGKYTEVGIPVRVRWRAVGLEIRILVEDEGPGIPVDERGAAFTRYARGARAKRDGLPGTGLGLALVKELVTEMHGSVRLVPSVVGTAIELRVPRARTPEPEEAA